MTKEHHEFGPIWSANSKILILGSFPSVKSRKEGFYYAHKQNRFWKILSEIFAESIANDIKSKTEFLLNHNIALWDVISSCDIEGSADSDIENPEFNDIKYLIDNSNIKRIYANGKLAYNLYQKYIYPITGIKAEYLPSTSPANAAFSADRLLTAWQVIKDM